MQRPPFFRVNNLKDISYSVSYTSNKTAFELPLTEVANSNIAGRTEVSLEFAVPADKKPTRHKDELTEIRFYVPGQHTKQTGDDEEEKSDAGEVDDDTSAAQVFHDAIKEKAEQVEEKVEQSQQTIAIQPQKGWLSWASK